jgi:cbb3-type cytochrome oxidase maturation protein
MDSIYILIPLGVVIAFVIGGVFFWAMSAGQFDDLDDEGRTVVKDDDTPDKPPSSTS